MRWVIVGSGSESWLRKMKVLGDVEEIPEVVWIAPGDFGSIQATDLVVLPSDPKLLTVMEAVFRAVQGEVRILVLFERESYSMMGEALRGQAIGFRRVPDDAEALVKLLRCYSEAEPRPWALIEQRYRFAA